MKPCATGVGSLGQRMLIHCGAVGPSLESRWLRPVLVEAAHVAAKTKQTYLAAKYKRIAARWDKKRALIALGHTILIIVYYLLTRKQPYQDLGTAAFDKLEQHRVEQRLVHRLGRLGYQVSLQASVA
jgi:transposase